MASSLENKLWSQEAKHFWEKLSYNHGILKFKDEFEALINDEDFSPQQLFNCDETCLNYCMLLKKKLLLLVSKSQKKGSHLWLARMLPRVVS